jgi:hypothetical protein
MLSQILKWVATDAIWRFIKPRLKSVLALIAILAVTTGVHDEFVEYVQLTQDKTWLLESYMLKWVVIIGSGFAYVAHNSHMFGGAELGQEAEVKEVLDENNAAKDDGFGFLRDKPNLIRKSCVYR